MKTIAENMTEMKEQSQIRGYFAAADDADVISDLLEDVRDTMMDYQVSISVFSTSYSMLNPMQTMIQKDIQTRTIELMVKI